MSTINGRACVANGRNLYLNSKAIDDSYSTNSGVTVTVEPFDSTTNMWHIVTSQGTSTSTGIYLYGYADDKLPDTSDWSYSADVKGTGKIAKFGIEAGSRNPVVGTVGSEWSRISQTGHFDNANRKTLIMYFDSTDSPVDIYIKLPKLEIGTTSTPLTPAPVDKVFSNGKQVYGRNLVINSNFSSGLDHWVVNRGTNADCKAVVTTDSDGDVCIHITGTGNVCGLYCYPVSFNQNQVTTGSVLLKGTGELILVGLERRPGSNFGTISTESYSKVSSTMQAISNTNAFTIYFNPVNGVIDIYIKFAKLELGSQATPYSPAPEDVM